jgi:hypothetical protein
MSATTTLRRILVLAALIALGAVAFSRLRTRPATQVAAPEWPPLTPSPSVDEPTASSAVNGAASTANTTASTRANAATAAGGDPAWTAPGEDGACPVGFPVKVKESSGIYHLPDGRFYERTHADRCYVDAAAAESDGYRRSKS